MRVCLCSVGVRFSVGVSVGVGVRTYSDGVWIDVCVMLLSRARDSGQPSFGTGFT